MEFKTEILQQVTILSETIDNFLADAFAGAITHWCGKVEPLRDKKTKELVGVDPTVPYEWFSDIVSRGGTLVLWDREWEESWHLDLPKMIKGISLYCQKHNKSYYQLQDDYDAEDVDCIVQYALFDNVEFA